MNAGFDQAVGRPRRVWVILGLLLLPLWLASCAGPAQSTGTATIPASGPTQTSSPTPTASATMTVATAAAPLEPTDTPTPAPTVTADAARVIARLSSGERLQFAELQMIDAEVGWGITAEDDPFQLRPSHHVVRTEDGGRTWQEVTPPQPVSADEGPRVWAEAFFLDDQRAWVVFPGQNAGSYVWRTDDGGRSWDAGAFFTRGALADAGAFLQFNNRREGWLLLSYFLGAGSYEEDILRTFDGGRTWETILLESYEHGPIRGFDAVNANVGWILGGHGAGFTPPFRLHLTRDGGLTWAHVVPTSRQAPLPLEGECEMGELQVTSSVGARVLRTCQSFQDPMARYFLGFTSDRGQKWRYLEVPGKPYSLGDRDGWALKVPQGPEEEREASTVFRTRDGGETWLEQGQLEGAERLHFADSTRGWAYGRGTLFASRDGGRTWTPLEPELETPLTVPPDSTRWVDLPTEGAVMDRLNAPSIYPLFELEVPGPVSVGAGVEAVFVGLKEGSLARWGWRWEPNVPENMPEIRVADGWIYEVAAHEDRPGFLAAAEDGRAYRVQDSSYPILEVIGGATGEVSGVARSKAGVLTSGEDGRIRLLRDPQSAGEPWRVARSFEGHDGWVWDVAVSPDESTLASAGSDGTVRLWSLQSGELEAVLRGHESAVTRIRFSPGGDQIASSSRDGTVRIWDVVGQEESAALQGHGDWVLDLAYSLHGDLLASVSADGELILWDASEGQFLGRRNAHQGAARGVAFRPDGRMLFTVGEDDRLRAWGIAP